MKRIIISILLLMFSLLNMACNHTETNEINYYTIEPYINLSPKEKIKYITKTEGKIKYGEYHLENLEIEDNNYNITTIWSSNDLYGFSYDLIKDDDYYLKIIIRLNENDHYYKFISEMYEDENSYELLNGAIGKLYYKTYNYNNTNDTIIFDTIDSNDQMFKMRTTIYIETLLNKTNKILQKYNLTLKDFGFII